MSALHQILVTLDAEFSPKTIETILQQGLVNNWIYLESYDYDSKPMDIQILTKKILREPRDEDNLIYTKYYDTYFSLAIFPSEGNKTEVSIGDFTYAWKKLFANSKNALHLNFASYIRLLLAACKNHHILTIQTNSII
jgi:hypothetical protein